MRRTVVASLMVAAVLGCVPGHAQSPAGLSGTWERDKTRSDAVTRRGQTLADADVTLVIEQSPPTVTIKRVVTTGPDRVARELTYTTDGKENKNKNPRGSEVITRSKWDDGKLVTKGRQPVPTPIGTVDADVSETWTLSPDGRTLTVESTTSGPRIGEIKRKEVFIRKS